MYTTGNKLEPRDLKQFHILIYILQHFQYTMNVKKLITHRRNISSMGKTTGISHMGLKPDLNHWTELNPVVTGNFGNVESTSIQCDNIDITMVQHYFDLVCWSELYNAKLQKHLLWLSNMTLNYSRSIQSCKKKKEKKRHTAMPAMFYSGYLNYAMTKLC